VLKPAARDEAHPVLRWLMTDARSRTDASEFLEAFALELRAAGVDVSRITTGVPILHPQIFSFSGLWQLGRARPNVCTAANRVSRRHCQTARLG
jgi:adenylate cyclase